MNHNASPFALANVDPTEGPRTKVRDALRSMPGWCSAADLATLTGLPRAAVLRHLNRIAEDGEAEFFERTGPIPTQWRKVVTP